MKQLSSLPFKSIDDILLNNQYYKEKLLKDSVLVFKNANLSYEQQDYLHRELSSLWGLYVNNSGKHSYVENHDHNDKVYTATADEIMLQWHVEHVYSPNPICFGTWNMYKFKTNSENGKTLFLDTSKIYLRLPKDWQEFLAKSYSDVGAMNDRDKDLYPIIRNHWINNSPVIRMHIVEDSKKVGDLKYFDGRTPTEEEKVKFKEICQFINDEVWNNVDDKLFHKWDEGDLLIPDVFKLAHAVTGGFDPSDREFSGMWAHLDEIK